MDIVHDKQKFTSNETKQEFKLKSHITCDTQYVIYLLYCTRGKQYIGKTIKHLRNCVNKHRNNIKRGFQLHSVSKHCWEQHRGENNPIRIIPIEHITIENHNRFETLKQREMYWIFKLKMLQPYGLNKSTEIII